MSEPIIVGWERALLAAERVKERLSRATKALDNAGVPYAVAGGNAVAEWVARIDDGAVRNTPDIDLLVGRADLDAVRSTLASVGFVHQYLSDVHVFTDGPDGSLRSGVHLLFAGEKLKVDDEHPCPNLDESERAAAFQVVSLSALVRMKLTCWRLHDRVHLRDLIQVGQIDATWPARFPPMLAERLQSLLDDPNG